MTSVEVLPRPEEKARAVESMFDRLAPRYDRMNRLLTFGMDQRWRRALLQRTGAGPGDNVLDLACGTGDLAKLATSLGSATWGIDFAAAMTKRARGRVPGAGIVRGDALGLPFPAGAFDVVVSGFAIRNFTDLESVFAEVARVTKPGGHFGILEIDEPQRAIVRLGHRAYFGRVVPRLGGLLSGDRPAYEYLAASASYLPAPQELGRLLKAAGFHRVAKRSHMAGAIQTVVATRQ